MWKRVERLMRGTIQNRVDRETRFTNEFDQFVAEPGEALVSVYNRFAQLMNDLEQNNMNFPTVTINTKFLNSLQPEWLKYVTQIRLAKRLTVDLQSSTVQLLHLQCKRHSARHRIWGKKIRTHVQTYGFKWPEFNQPDHSSDDGPSYESAYLVSDSTSCHNTRITNKQDLSALSSTEMNATSRVRRPISRDSHVAHNVLDNSKNAKRNVAVYVRKNKQEDVIPNKENVIEVDVANASKAKTLLCGSCSSVRSVGCWTVVVFKAYEVWPGHYWKKFHENFHGDRSHLALDITSLALDNFVMEI
ncbi:hypothetical protein Tco_0516799 [Tanacetum coccineum]